MATALGLRNRRFIQKCLTAGAPDATDAEAEADWATLERSWRGWLGSHPRMRRLTLLPPVTLDAAAHLPAAQPAAEGAAAGTDQADEGLAAAILREKLRRERAQADLAEDERAERRGHLVSRDVVTKLASACLQLAAAEIQEYPAHLAAALPPAARDGVRAAGRTVTPARLARLRAEIQRQWHAIVPTLIPAGT